MRDNRHSFSHVAQGSEGASLNQSFSVKKSCPERPSIADMENEGGYGLQPPQLYAHQEEDKEVGKEEEKWEDPTGAEPYVQQEAQHEELQPEA